MERKIVSEEELLEILNKEFSKYPDYPNCSFISIDRKLSIPDKNGCNWDNASVKCAGISASLCSQIVVRIVAETKKKYNLENKGVKSATDR